MAKEKEVVAIIKLQVTGGSATPAPPVGPALGQQSSSSWRLCSKV